MTRTPAFRIEATTLSPAGLRGTMTLAWPKEAGKPSAATAAALPERLQASGTVLSLQVVDNKGSKGVVATATR